MRTVTARPLRNVPWSGQLTPPVALPPGASVLNAVVCKQGALQSREGDPLGTWKKALELPFTCTPYLLPRLRLDGRQPRLHL